MEASKDLSYMFLCGDKRNSGEKAHNVKRNEETFRGGGLKVRALVSSMEFFMEHVVAGGL